MLKRVEENGTRRKHKTTLMGDAPPQFSLLQSFLCVQKPSGTISVS